MTQTEMKCAAQHFGPWWVLPSWLNQALSAYRSGLIGPAAAVAKPPAGEPADGLGFTMYGSVAKISVIGQMTKGESSFGGTSTIRTRQALRAAMADDKVRAILMAIDSPGGTVAGTVDLADDVARAGTVKPVWAHVDDTGASGAYYVAAGAERITANRNAILGSIGTVMVLEDSSKMAADLGVEVHVLSTGPNKGTGIPGAPVTKGQLAAEQTVIDDLGEQFVDHINSSRRLALKLGEGAADGRVMIAAKALKAGLIDAVQSFGVTLAEMQAALAAEDAGAIAKARHASQKNEVQVLTRPASHA